MFSVNRSARGVCSFSGTLFFFPFCMLQNEHLYVFFAATLCFLSQWYDISHVGLSACIVTIALTTFSVRSFFETPL